jgi:uncharacterized protein
MLWRKHAQRLLVERGQRDVVPELIGLVRDRSVDRIGLNVGAIHALWTLHGLGTLDGSPGHAAAYEAAAEALDHPSAGVRRNAVAVLPRTEATRTLLLDPKVGRSRRSGQAGGAAGAVRAAVVRDGWHAVAQFLKDPANLGDRWLQDAAGRGGGGS